MPVKQLLGLGLLGPSTVWETFDISLVTFAAYMAKRAGQGPFAAAPIVQGDFDGSGTPDVINYLGTGAVGNATQFQRDVADPYQGSIVLWWTPEKDRDATFTVNETLYYSSASFYIKYEHDNQRIRLSAGGQTHNYTLAIVAGTTYCVVCRWDINNTLDGTNYISISVNDAHDFGVSTQPSAVAPNANQFVGGDNAGGGITDIPANAIIEGLTVYRRPLTDGTYGVRPMNGNQYSNDEINAIWNAGAGRDPTLVTGSEDVCFCLPTNSTEEILASGAGEAWSWPWEDNLPDVWGMWDGGLPGTDRAVEFNGADTAINCGSDVDIDDIADAEMTVEAWIRADSWGENGEGVIMSKGGYNTAGWYLRIDDIFGIRASVECATTDAESITENSPTQPVNFLDDGKLHHIVMYFNDAGDRKIYLALDGVWITDYQAQIAGVGAIVTDAATDLQIGRDSTGTRTFDGGFAWAAISKNDRHTVGTDFIPPRAVPADDANYLAIWPMDEGAGATIDNIGNQGGAGSGAANRDGTLANGSWSSIWEQDATPVIPQSLEADGSTTFINYGSGVNIDDLPDGGAITVEAWIRLKDLNGTILCKQGGWSLYVANTFIRFIVDYDDTSSGALDSRTDHADGRWHHFAGTYDEGGDRKARIWWDGVLVATGGASVGNYIADAAVNLHACRNLANDGHVTGAIGWHRVSNSIRYTDTFVPDARTNPPANDANAQLLVIMTDGAGTTTDDTSGNTYDGTITMGAGQWNNTPDMEIDEPGAAIYGPKGYNLGVDAALERMYDEQIVVAETDYVVFPVLSIGESGRARPRIRIRDVSNAADVVIFNGPMLYGTHTGANNQATLQPTTPRWIADALIGATVYNITDGSSAVITDNSETVVTGGLAGGTDNDWDTNDVFVIRFPRGYCEAPWQESFCFQTPAGCILLRVYVENVNAEGVMQIHQVQVLENLLTNGDHENLTGGNPDLITGWVNQGLDPGDTQASSGGGAVIHSGVEALQWDSGATERMYKGSATPDTGDFVAMGLWSYGDGVAGLEAGAFSASYALLQYSDSLFEVATPVGALWACTSMVLRTVIGNVRHTIGEYGGGLSAYTDDVYIVHLDNVSLTVTPASQANSLEAGGIRVDGRDTLTQPVTELKAASGNIRFNVRPRHSTANGAVQFGQAREYVFRLYEDANNYIEVYRTSNNVSLRYNANGAGLVAGNWVSAGLWDEDVDVEIRVQYGAFGAFLIIDGITRVTLAGPVVFATDFTLPINWGTRQDGELQLDGVIS